MHEPASHGAASRVPVCQGQQRIVGLWQRTLADGSIVYETQKRVDGKMCRIPHAPGLTKTEAVLAHRKLTVGVEEGEVKIGDRSLTVKALVADFLARERGVLGTRAETTVRLYELRLTKHVLPVIGSMKAEDVKVQHVRKLLDSYKAQGQAGASVRSTIAALSAAYRHGVVHLGVTRNPVRGLERGELPSGKRTSEPRYLSAPEVEALLAKMSDESRPIASACFYAATRVSEALALTWADIDFDAKTVRVPGTKTEASEAKVRLLPPLADELRAHRARQAALGFERVKPTAPVFATASGKPVHRRNVLRAVSAAARRAGLVGEGQEAVGVHDLRHSLAANALDLGLTTHEVSQLLRHAHVGVTETVYAGVLESKKLAAGDKLAAGLGGA